MYPMLDVLLYCSINIDTKTRVFDPNTCTVQIITFIFIDLQVCNFAFETQNVFRVLNVFDF